jgi:hypothetical protein
MWRQLAGVLVGVIVCSAVSAADDQKTEIKGGIEAKVKKVDVDAKTLTVTTEQGRVRTFTINDETTMVGPRGGKVRRRLKDPRFYEGMSVTIVAEGNTATEVHLGYQHRDGDEKAVARDAEKPKKASDATRDKERDEKPAARDAEKAKKVGDVIRGKAAAKPTEEDDDNEIPGKIKRFERARHMLVITLLNGKDRSFLLSKDVKVLVKGTTSKHGLEDPALKTGASIEVVTDEGGHKVKELKVTPALAQRRKAS